MNWTLAPALTAALATAVGAYVGHGLGQLLGMRADGMIPLAVLGGALGAALCASVERHFAVRLMNWVTLDHAAEAPVRPVFWGELGYRIERALRSRDSLLDDERTQRIEFLAAIEASPNGVLLLDVYGDIEWCNAIAADHFGLDPKRDLRQRITNLVRHPTFVAYLQAGEFDQAVTFSSPRGDLTLSVLVRPHSHGKQLVLTQDITERERAEAMRRDFVANVSHEIRTPLTVLGGFVETMAELPLSKPEQARVLGLMTQQTDRMQALVGDLLILAQLEGSPRPPPDTWVSVQTLLDHALAEALPLSQGRHRLTVGVAPDVEVAGSLTELKSALGNLVTNAVRYTPDGGSIDVISTVNHDGSVALSVKDTGLGIAREHLSRLTERFYRVDGSRSRETGGTGLGLAIVKHVMQRHGGEIEIASEVGTGSTFKLTIPGGRVRRVPTQP